MSAAAIVLVASGSGCAARHPTSHDYGVERCRPTSADGLLSTNMLQCWIDARHGRWRILSHESHYDVLVVQVETSHLEDADEIARRFVAGNRRSFSEILVYARPESVSASSRIRRVRWTRDGGFDALEFQDLID